MTRDNKAIQGEVVKAGKGKRVHRYSPAVIDELCMRVRRGLSLTVACAEMGINRELMCDWMYEHKELDEAYTRACAKRTDLMAEDLLDISDTPVMGTSTVVRDDGTSFTRTEDMLNHRRLQVDTRKWVMSKMNPGRYGDKLDVTSGGDKLPVPIIDISATGDPKKGNPS